MSNGADRAAGSGSPITVDGGGSVSISFGHKFYDCGCGNKADPHTHNNQNAKIDRIEITGYEPIKITGKAKVKIFLRDHIA
jgi:hypothetical protein